ncbi:alpha/beta hydrolase [Legionella micdadei]|uniref:Uncharacterized protein n=1 Tax=Legionella micdadei TaxID=451 RepID=A0A098GLA3_LEGMI|nr:alpha/beta hydrolase [Legionella micdadei]ARG98687.1 alpha/beta hydrolase [Legionella micdadei]ARH01403.1 alpha/beta hydrolase [Legionella micdadei]KTD28896.1 2-hydroxy-6-oxononadienedioate/2-hydroxy-6-oxononatrienedioate hydrolase [Legionella micdadei]CEG62276.1 conserved protein of unknown function [Legionella micdadei]SCY05115.1 hypothetical protein SAMN02982997_00717 [Legionella micdadei]
MIKQLLVVGLIVVLITLLLMYLLQRHLIYFPAKEMPQRIQFHADDMGQLQLLTPDGLYLNAWYKPASENQPTILYLHGNAGHIGYRMPLVRQFLADGFGVLLLEYRGYGGNKGNPSEEGLYMDGRTAMHFLQGKGVAAHHLVLYGESLGTAVATKMASEFPACAVILQSPLASLAAVARYHYPWVFIEPWDKFDSLVRIANINTPLLILHGEQDQIIPFAQGLSLYNQANKPKRLIILKNKGHNDIWDAEFFAEVIHFIRTYCS